MAQSVCVYAFIYQSFEGHFYLYNNLYARKYLKRNGNNSKNDVPQIIYWLHFLLCLLQIHFYVKEVPNDSFEYNILLLFFVFSKFEHLRTTIRKCARTMFTICTMYFEICYALCYMHIRVSGSYPSMRRC